MTDTTQSATHLRFRFYRRQYLFRAWLTAPHCTRPVGLRFRRHKRLARMNSACDANEFDGSAATDPKSCSSRQ